MFERKGLLVIDRASAKLEEDDLLMLALEAGAEDFEAAKDSYEITTTPDTFTDVKNALEAEGCTFTTAEVTRGSPKHCHSNRGRCPTCIEADGSLGRA